MNLSEGGCAVRGTKPIPNQAVLLLRFYPPDWDSPIEIKSARVCWVRGWDFGVEFLNVKPELQLRLRHLIQELQTQKNKVEC